jgi:hypothetical protein
VFYGKKDYCFSKAYSSIFGFDGGFACPGQEYRKAKQAGMAGKL